VVFFGSYTPLQGAPVIGETLRLLADEQQIVVTMVGDGQDARATRHAGDCNENVTWIDWVEPEALPYLVASHDVCLGIFGDTGKALRVVPTKLFQGAAAGAAIVTSDTPPQRQALGDGGLFIPPNDPHALADALRLLASDHDLLWRLQQEAYRTADRCFRPGSVIQELDLVLTKTWAASDLPAELQSAVAR
jgi:glycosyltransferase involved in cell wall biosynthesis